MAAIDRHILNILHHNALLLFTDLNNNVNICIEMVSVYCFCFLMVLQLQIVLMALSSF